MFFRVYSTQLKVCLMPCGTLLHGQIHMQNYFDCPNRNKAGWLNVSYSMNSVVGPVLHVPLSTSQWLHGSWKATPIMSFYETLGWMGSHCVALAQLKLSMQNRMTWSSLYRPGWTHIGIIPLPLLPRCWDSRCGPPRWTILWNANSCVFST